MAKKRASPEKKIQNEILGFLRTIGVMCWTQNNVGVFDPTKKIFRKNNGPYHLKGISDILGIIPYYYQDSNDNHSPKCLGRFLAIEVKSETGVISPEQRIFIAKINEEGGIAFATRSLENCISQLLKFFPENQRLKQFAKDYAKSGGTEH